MVSRLEQLNRIAVGIFNLNLFAARADFHLISKTHASFSQISNPRRRILHLKKHTVPSAGLLLTTIGIDRDPEAPGPLKINLRPPIETWPKRGRFCISRWKPIVCV